MQPENWRFGGGASDTILHPLVAVSMLIAIALILTAPRTKAVVPFLLTFFTIPIGQVVVLAGVHLIVHQILILTVLARMIAFRGSSSEKRFTGGFNTLDKVVVLWALSTLIVFYLEFLETQVLIKGLGDLVINLGGYLAVRFLIPNREALRSTTKAFVAICVIQGICMISEQFTAQNVFNFLGAHNPDIRNGHIRSEGALGTLYGGPMAGVLIPLFLWLLTKGKSRMTAYAGLAGATAMVWASHASTPWMAFGGSVLGLAFWPLRKQMRLVRWGLVATLTGLHLVMNGPVWSLIEKIDLTDGNSSYHRYMLVDNCIRHFSDWWLLGYKYYGDWGWDMFDLCNQFVAVALTGGLVTFVLFIQIYKRGFGMIGTARKLLGGSRSQEWLLWCLGSSLFGNIVASFGINYMYHLLTYFLILLACISAATFSARQAAIETDREEGDFASTLDSAEMAPWLTA